jgi:Na+-transporting methylmalonyl-CoA/oxaloacetate decarboxylase gamma subunit
MELTVFQGVQIAVYGFLTVFLMLSVLMCVIMVVNKIVQITIEKQEKKPTTSVVENVEPVVPQPAVFTGEIKLYDVDEKTAACLMAIISDETNIPLDRLIFKSIRAVEEK